MTLEEEERRVTEMLAGKTVSLVRCHRSEEVLVEFTDGTRFFVNSRSGVVELSITGHFNDDDEVAASQ